MSVGYVRWNNLESIAVGLLCFDALSYWEPCNQFMILLVCHLRKTSKTLVPINDYWRSGPWIGGRKYLPPLSGAWPWACDWSSGYFWPDPEDRLGWTGVETKQAYSCVGLRMGLTLPGFRDKLIWERKPAVVLQCTSFLFLSNIWLNLLKVWPGLGGCRE